MEEFYLRPSGKKKRMSDLQTVEDSVEEDRRRRILSGRGKGSDYRRSTPIGGGNFGLNKQEGAA